MTHQVKGCAYVGTEIRTPGTNAWWGQALEPHRHPPAERMLQTTMS